METNDQEKPVEQEYIQIVEEAIRRDLDVDIPNSTFEHAKFLTSKLLESATKEVKILSGSLNEVLYCGKINNIFKSLLERRVNIKIVIWHDTKKSTLDSLKALGGNLEIKVANRPKEPRFYENIKHFLVVDNKAYRIEEPHSPQEECKPFEVKGTANFNRPQMAEVLTKAFDGLWGHPGLVPA